MTAHPAQTVWSPVESPVWSDYHHVFQPMAANLLWLSAVFVSFLLDAHG